MAATKICGLFYVIARNEAICVLDKDKFEMPNATAFNVLMKSEAQIVSCLAAMSIFFCFPLIACEEGCTYGLAIDGVVSLQNLQNHSFTTPDYFW